MRSEEFKKMFRIGDVITGDCFDVKFNEKHGPVKITGFGKNKFLGVAKNGFEEAFGYNWCYWVKCNCNPHEIKKEIELFQTLAGAIYYKTII